MHRRFLTRAAAFVALPLLVLEVAFRILAGGPLAGANALVDFYRPVAAHVDTADVGVLLVGSSRVAGAINAATLSDALATDGASRVHVLNVGQGYSTPVVHYFALADLIAAHPERFRGATVLVETRDGLPDATTWRRDWAHEEWPTLLSPVLPVSQIASFWWTSDNALATKALVTSAALSYTVRFWKMVRGRLTAVTSTVADRVVHTTLAAPAPDSTIAPATDDADLTTDGGIRTDSAGVALARQRALDAARQTSHTPVTDWSDSAWADLHRELQRVGGRLAFFDVPMSSIDRASASGDAFDVSRAAFARWADAHDIVRLSPTSSFDDDAFPDLLHLSASEAPTYTRSLADAYRASM